RTFISETMPLAVSWLSQKPGSPIFASSSLRRAFFWGTLKRVPDRNDPGRKVFDRLRQVLVNHAPPTVTHRPQTRKPPVQARAAVSERPLQLSRQEVFS